MPISRKSFEKGYFKTRYEDRSKHPVTLLLSKNTTQAFTVKEISRSVGMKLETVRSTLFNLKKENKIVHKTPYFAWKTVKKKNLKKRINKKRR